jgi:Ca2+-binding EF-hand superfamily protein
MEQAKKMELERLKTVFDSVDADGGGFIDADEVGLLAHNLFGTQLTALELRRAMKELDTDGSGTISFDEFQVSPSAPGPPQPSTRSGLSVMTA